MVGRAVRGSLDPLRREADSHTRQGKVLMCPSEEELEDPFQEAVTAGLGVGKSGREDGGGGWGESQLPGAPPRSYNGAHGSYYDT